MCVCGGGVLPINWSDMSGNINASNFNSPGTMPRNVSQEPLKLRSNDAALYSLEKNGSLVKRVEPVSLSNGLAWTADNKASVHSTEATNR